MTPRQQADKMIAERMAALYAENAYLRGEVQGLVGITMSQRQVDRLLALPVGGDNYERVALGRVFA